MDKDSIPFNFPKSKILNLSNYSDYINLLECSLCRNIATSPKYCENCKNSFCLGCLNELNLVNNRCPNCMLENVEVSTSNEKFYEFFKDLLIQCDLCDEKVPYNLASNHKCFKIMSKKQEIIVDRNEKQEEEEYKKINDIIHIRCQKCKQFVDFNKRDNHCLICQGIQPISFQINPPLRQCRFCFRNLPGSSVNDEINHLTECPEYVKKISPSLLENAGKLINAPNPIPVPIPGKTVNMLDILDNFNKLSVNLDNTNMQLLTATMNSLEKSIINFQSNLEASFCRYCKTVKKNFELITCKCCNKKYCTNCCIACPNCEGVISKNCQFTCQNCKMLKCPLCEIQSGSFCMCLEHKFCKTCFENPNINNLSISLLKGPHLSCSYVKLLDVNVYAIKFPKFNFKAEISLNSVKQYISISLVKNGVEMFSRIFAININDKLGFLYEKNELKIGSSSDYWSVDMKSIEGEFDYIILNFNANPNYAITLNKLNTSNFDNLSSASIVGGGVFDMFSRKNLINHIIFQKSF